MSKPKAKVEEVRTAFGTRILNLATGGVLMLRKGEDDDAIELAISFGNMLPIDVVLTSSEALSLIGHFAAAAQPGSGKSIIDVGLALDARRAQKAVDALPAGDGNVVLRGRSGELHPKLTRHDSAEIDILCDQSGCSKRSTAGMPDDDLDDDPYWCWCDEHMPTGELSLREDDTRIECVDSDCVRRARWSISSDEAWCHFHVGEYRLRGPAITMTK